jgi:peptidylprolyl isomerase
VRLFRPALRRAFPLLALSAFLVACGSDAKTSSSTATTAAATTTAAGSSAKPAVKIPAQPPTKLEITDLTEGTGEPAKSGDTVVVNYVGVRSADGVEFDNSYDRGQPFPVTLGEGGVIQGWDQGLIGAKAGGRRQLDIPADLAYGQNPPGGGVIKPGDALTFVIDIVSVTPGVDVPEANAADKPKVDVKPTTDSTSSSTDLVVGTGDEAVAGSTVYVQLIVHRGDTGAELQSTWEGGKAVKLVLDQTTLPGIVDGITGMKVGGRRQLVIAPADAFGPSGNPNVGLPPGADMIMIVDLVLVVPPAG